MLTLVNDRCLNNLYIVEIFMKKLKKLGLLCSCILFLTSCSNLVTDLSENRNNPKASETSKENKGTVTSSKGMNYLGDINKIYSSSTSSRFVTGQIIDNFCGHKVKFEGNLVEYNSIKKEILDYVEGLDSNNSLMHQNYENVSFDPTKKYVEFSSYTDTTSGKIVRFEIRVFYGNFLETYKTDLWYAKSVMFNSSFTKDMNKNVKVDFGEPLGPEEDDEETGTGYVPPVIQTTEDKINNELINLIGTPAKIYSAPNTTARFCTGQILNWGNTNARFQGNLVEYSSVKPEIMAIFDNISFNAMNHQGYSNVTYDNTKTYIEVCFYEDIQSGDVISYELRLIDDSYFTGITKGWYAKEYQFSTLSDIQ